MQKLLFWIDEVKPPSLSIVAPDDVMEGGQVQNGSMIVVARLDKPSHQLAFFDNTEREVLFDQSIEKWRTLGADVIELEFEPLFLAARLLYESPWVAERYAALETLIESNPDHVHEVVRGIVQSAKGKTAVDAFKSAFQLQEYKTHCKSQRLGARAGVI